MSRLTQTENEPYSEYEGVRLNNILVSLSPTESISRFKKMFLRVSPSAVQENFGKTHISRISVSELHIYRRPMAASVKHYFCFLAWRSTIFSAL